jgi:cell division protein FtsQ
MTPVAEKASHPEKNGTRRRRGSIVLLALLGTGVLGLALKANAWKLDLPISGVRVGGNAIVTTAEVLRLAGIPKQGKLFALDLAAVRERIKRNPYLREVSVNRQGPEGISIEVVERQPVAIVAGEVLLYVDEEGVVLPPAHSEKLFDLPVITGAVPGAECVPGKRMANVAVREALRLVVLSRTISEDLFRRISDVQVLETGELLVHTAEAGVPVFLGAGSLGEKLVTFDGFWRAIVDRRGPQQLQQVDLRFADQVVVRWSGEAAPR